MTNGRHYSFTNRYFLPASVFWILTLVAVVSSALIWPRRWRAAIPKIRAPENAEQLRRLGYRFLLSAALCALGIFGVAYARGMLFWLSLGAASAYAILALRYALAVVGLGIGRRWRLDWLLNIALVCASVTVVMTAGEGYLAWKEKVAMAAVAKTWEGSKQGVSRLPEGSSAAGGLVVRTGKAEITLPARIVARMKARMRVLTLPDAWKRKPVTIRGTRAAYTWMGVIHIFDNNYFRRHIGPFPAKKPGVFRIMVVGDSLTYGFGLPAKWSYPAQLQRAMQRRYNVQVFNLGKNGWQSEDVARVVRKMLPVLKPDLVIYGVCENDFLPSGIEDYVRKVANPLPSDPLPQWFKKLTLDRTRLAGFVGRLYDASLRRLGVRTDFYDDILKNFKGYQGRFFRDVQGMNEDVLQHGLPPIVAITLDQFAIYGGKGYKISQIAERLMKRAGMDVIPMEGYFKKYMGQGFVISRFEAHPNEEAQAIFATMIYNHLMGKPYLERFRKPSKPNRAPSQPTPGASAN